jgi:hypothetical protein
MCDGILHLEFPRAEWHSAFETELEAAADQLDIHDDKILDRRRRDDAAKEKERIAPYVTRHISDARYSALKSSVAKPDVDLSIVVLPRIITPPRSVASYSNLRLSASIPSKVLRSMGSGDAEPDLAAFEVIGVPALVAPDMKRLVV